MLTEDRFNHSLGVAKRCQEIAAEQGYNEDFQQEMYNIGIFKDIGHQFLGHDIQADVALHFLSQIHTPSPETIEALYGHGKLIPAKKQNAVLRILNQADMEISFTGERVTPAERLEEIIHRHGKDSEAYKTSLYLCQELKLI